MPGAGDVEQNKCEVPTSGSVQMMALSAEINSQHKQYLCDTQENDSQRTMKSVTAVDVLAALLPHSFL